MGAPPNSSFGGNPTDGPLAASDCSYDDVERTIRQYNRHTDIQRSFGLVSTRAEDIERLSMAIGWITMTLVSAGNPLVMKWAYINDSGKVSYDKFNPATAHLVSFLISVVVAGLAVVLYHGVETFKLCFSLRRLIYLAPVSLGFSIAEWLGFVGIVRVSPILYAVVQKSKLVQTTILSATVLRRKVYPSQWIIAFQLTCIVIAFVLMGIRTPTGALEYDLASLIVLFVCVMVAVLAATYGDWMYKRDRSPILVQLCAGRCSAAIGSLIISVSYHYYMGWQQYGFFGGPGGGWDYRVVLATAWFVLRDWSITYVLKNLDAIWKTVGSACAIGLTYLGEIALMGREPDTPFILMVLALIMGVILHTLERERTKALVQAQKIIEASNMAAAVGPVD